MSLKPDAEDATAYPKIPSPFTRDHVTNLLTAEWSSPELEATAGLPWVFTEKVDGTNVRIIWDGYRVTFAGRTLRATLPLPLLAWLEERFGGPEKEQLFEQKFGDEPAVLYGEGYGAGIQSGGRYREDQAVVLFDVRVGNWWLQRDDVGEVAAYFGVHWVSIRYARPLTAMVAEMSEGHVERSLWGDFPPEGLVGVTAAGLRRRDGQRLIVKLKNRDLAPKASR